jgi:hypothetical protein
MPLKLDFRVSVYGSLIIVYFRVLTDIKRVIQRIHLEKNNYFYDVNRYEAHIL